MQKILVTGAAGFIGYSFSKLALSKSYQILGIDNMSQSLSSQLKEARLSQLIKNPSFIFKKGDLRDASFIENTVADYKPDFIVHLGAQTGVRLSSEQPQLYIESNVLGTVNIFEAARKFPVKKIIYASSSSVYGANKKLPFSEADLLSHQLSVYGATKASNELCAKTYSHLYQLPLIGLRFFTVYGPWGRPDMSPFLFVESILKNKPIQIFNHGKMERDFTYIDDITDGIFKSLHSPYTNEIFNLGSAQTHTLEKYIETIETALNKKAIREYLPHQSVDLISTYAHIQKAKEKLNWIPQTILSDGIQKFTTWYQEFYQ